MLPRRFSSSNQGFAFGQWEVSAPTHHINKSKDVKRLAEAMELPSPPEMLFGHNALRIIHRGGYGIEFNATDALKRANRMDSEPGEEVQKLHGWVYTTDYRGTLIGEDMKIQVTETTEQIDREKLRVREQIQFQREVFLFEDKLLGHGVSMLTVRIRVMRTSFFLRLRFFLRVDGVLIRINDTRLYHETGKSFMLREFSTRENSIEELQNVPAAFSMGPDEMVQYLTLKQTHCEKLQLPVAQPHTH